MEVGSLSARAKIATKVFITTSVTLGSADFRYPQDFPKNCGPKTRRDSPEAPTDLLWSKKLTCLTGSLTDLLWSKNHYESKGGGAQLTVFGPKNMTYLMGGPD